MWGKFLIRPREEEDDSSQTKHGRRASKTAVVTQVFVVEVWLGGDDGRLPSNMEGPIKGLAGRF
jgi:hypothetical protein